MCQLKAIEAVYFTMPIINQILFKMANTPANW